MQTVWFSLIVLTITFVVVYVIYCFFENCKFPGSIFNFYEEKQKQLIDEKDFELVFVQALWRHGDRGPQAPFKNSRVSETKWKNIGSGVGELTKKGVKQQLELGKGIRQRYVESGFLPYEFDKNLIKFQSTNRNRTIQSALSNIAGMYSEPSALGIDPETLIKIPKDYSNDCVNNVMCTCKRRHFLQNMAENLDEYRKIVEDSSTAELFSNLSKVTGEQIDAGNFWRVPDTLRCEKEHFPEGTEGKLTLNRELEELNTKLNKFTSGVYPSSPFLSHEISKIRSGPIISEIYKRMLAVKQAAVPLKYHAYSSHDMTLFSVLSAFGLQDLTSSEVGGWPSCASAIFIELFSRKADGTHFFRIVYRNPKDGIFSNVTPKVPRCEGKAFCEFETLQNVYDSVRIEIPVSKHCQHVSDLV